MLMWLVTLVGFLRASCLIGHMSFWLTVICWFWLVCWSKLEDLGLLLFPRSKVMRMRAWFEVVGFGRLIKLVITWLMRLLIWVAEGLALMSSMPEGITLVPVELGIRLLEICIAFLLPWPELWSLMMVREALLLTLWFGLLQVDLSVGDLLKLLEILPCCLVCRGFDLVGGFNGLTSLSLLMTLVAGLSLLVLWLRLLLSWVVFLGLVRFLIWVVGGSHMLSS